MLVKTPGNAMARAVAHGGGSANRPGYLSAVLTGLRCVEQPHQRGVNGSSVHYALRLHEL